MALFLTHCDTHSSKVQDNAPDSTRPPKGVIKLSEGNCDFFTPDTSIYGIKLSDTTSVLKVIGAKYKIVEDKSRELPYMSYVNNDGREEIFLIVHYESPRYEFNEVEVNMEASPGVTSNKIAVDHFTTGLGIHIGMTKADVISRLGSCYTSSLDHMGNEELHYRLHDYNNSDFLKRYNMPLYYGFYTFKSSILIKFKFGFGHP